MLLSAGRDVQHEGCPQCGAYMALGENSPLTSRAGEGVSASGIGFRT